MRICMIEPAGDGECGSIGAHFVAESARNAGYQVDVISASSDDCGYDVELVSIHHPSDYPRLVKMKKHGKVRVIGGHITYNNPRPVIPLADYLCIGDGETWIVEFLSCLSSGKDPADEVEGTVDCKRHIAGSKLPQCRYEKKLNNSPYLNREGTRSAAWYIEIARGCPFSCHYCELGNSMPYRFVLAEKVIQQIRSIDRSKSKKIVFFAPDEASHPAYNLLLDEAAKAGVRQCFGSYRIDQIMRTGGLHVMPNQLIRVGIDGMTEETRFKVSKKIKDSEIVDYFRLMTSLGHVNFKMFQMFGHPWEKNSDFDQWERLMRKVCAIPLQKNVSLRIKWTPLIPQPVTPLAGVKPIYSLDLVNKIKIWHKLVSKPSREPGWFITLDGIMSAKSHTEQIKMTVGDESTLL